MHAKGGYNLWKISNFLKESKSFYKQSQNGSHDLKHSQIENKHNLSITTQINTKTIQISSQ